MSHLRGIVPFEPTGKMKVAVDAVQKEFDELIAAIDMAAPANLYTKVAKVLLEMASHYVKASFMLYATGTPNETPMAQMVPAPQVAVPTIPETEE